MDKKGEFSIGHVAVEVRQEEREAGQVGRLSEGRVTACDGVCSGRRREQVPWGPECMDPAVQLWVWTRGARTQGALIDKLRKE